MSKKGLIMAGVALGVFLSAIDSSIVGTAMPTVIASLGGGEVYTWVFASYMLTSTASTPLFGKMSDLFGQKMLFVISVGLFLLGSALSGSAQSMTQLIIFRALQGIGGGGLNAMAFTIIGHVFSPTERPKMQGFLGAMWAISAVIGPAAGGLIVDNLSWRWTFYINLPIGVIPVALVLLYLEDTVHGTSKPRIDFAGAAFLTGSILALLFALLEGDARGWTSAYILGLFGLSLVLMALFIWNEARTPEPIVPLSLFKLRTFSVCNLGNLFSGAALFGITGFIPLFVQGVLGGSATEAGIAIMPLSLGWPLGSVLGGQAVNRVGYRNMGVFGMALMTLGFYMLAGMGVDSSAVIAGRNMFVAGLGMGLLSPAVTAAIQNSVPRGQMGVASSSISFYRTIGGTVGVSVMGAILNGQMGSWVFRLVDSGAARSISSTIGVSISDPQVLLKPELSSRLPQTVLSALEHSLSNSLHAVFVVSLWMLLFGLAISVLMPNSTPAQDMERLSRTTALNPEGGQ